MITGEFIKRSIVGAMTLGGAIFTEPEYSFADISVPSGQSLKLGPQTSQPIGHHDFCNANIYECTRTFGDVPRAVLTPSLWKLIGDVDAKFNKKITAMNDPQQWGKDELWSFADTNFGDCEDYALEKRRALIDTIHPANLLLTVVKKPDGEGHAVLTVRTDRGDFFLDNLKPPMPVDQSNYTIIKTVDPKDEGRWVSVQGRENISVYAADAAAMQSPKPGLF